MVPDSLADGGVDSTGQTPVTGHGNVQLLALLLVSNLKKRYFNRAKLLQ